MATLDLQDPGQLISGLAHCIAVRHSWPGYVFVLEQNCVRDALRPASLDVNVDVVIMVGAGANVPAIHAVLCPQPAICCLFMALDLTL